MADFKILLDDLGVETAPANCSRSKVRVVTGAWTVKQYGAIAVVPVSTQSTTSGALKGAAWGVFLAGPMGAAIGSMVGGGMKVAFELHTLEGVVLQCIASKDAYLDIKKQVETRPAQPPKPKQARPERTGPRRIGALLGIGIAILPWVFGLFLFRRGHTGRDRAIVAAWTVLWTLGLGMLPEPPDTTPPADAAVMAAP